jgi:hypothetical protein
MSFLCFLRGFYVLNGLKVPFRVQGRKTRPLTLSFFIYFLSYMYDVYLASHTDGLYEVQMKLYKFI